MISLTKKGLPNVVVINGNPYSIYTDFRLWMRFEIELGKMKKGDYLDISYLFKNEMPAYCNINELLVFCRPSSKLPRSSSQKEVQVIDYELDADYIYAAFLSQYGIDLCDIDHLHWYKFLALLKGLKNDERIKEIMSYRCYEKNNGKKDIYEELKEAWRIDDLEEENPEEIEKFSQYFQ